MLEAEEYAASPMNAEMQVDPLALDFQAGRLRCPVTVVSRNSCKTSIFLPSTRRNQGNGVNHSANLHTIRRTEENQGIQGYI